MCLLQHKPGKSIAFVLNLALASASCVGLPAAQARQAASSVHPETTTPHAGPTASRSSGARAAAGSGGGSSWTAGRGSFSSSVQRTDGVWSAGSTLAATPPNRDVPPSGASKLSSTTVPSSKTVSKRIVPAATASRNAAQGGGLNFHSPEPVHSASGSRGGRSSATPSFLTSSHGGRLSLGSPGGNHARRGGFGPSRRAGSGSSSMRNSKLKQGDEENSPLSGRQHPSGGERGYGQTPSPGATPSRSSGLTPSTGVPR